MNQIIIELCTEDRARLDRLADALEAMAQNQPRQLYALDLGSAPIEGAETEAQAPEAETPKETQPEPEKPTEPKNDAPAVTVDDIRSKYMSLSAAQDQNKKKQAQAIIKEYAAKINEIPADKVAEVLEKLNALEG
jgi:hypothetical protein